MIALVERFVRHARTHSKRVEAACANNEATWINHSLITVILGGGLGALLGWAFGIPQIGFRLGLMVALLCYLYREVGQWAHAEKPAGWWFDATMDVLVPCWIASPFLLGASGFYVLTLCVATIHFALRPVE